LGAEVSFLVVQAVHHHDERIGILVAAVEPDQVRGVGLLRGQIASALVRVHLREQKEAAEVRAAKQERLRALGRTVAGLAHEVNTPLGVAVTGVSTLLSRADLGAEVRETLDLVSRCLARACSLVEAFREISADPGEARGHRFALDDVVAVLPAVLREVFAGAPVDVRIDVEPRLWVAGLPGGLLQILQALGSNATVHGFPAPGRPSTVRITAHQSGPHVVLKFSDNGRGIDPADLPRIYEPFHTTRRAQGGLGLGLAIVHHLVTDVFEGTVECVSHLGEGTEFVLTLTGGAS
jgi:signal transduction histidine kinase